MLDIPVRFFLRYPDLKSTNSRDQFTISTWEPTPAAQTIGVPSDRRQHTRLVAACASILLHALIVLPIILKVQDIQTPAPELAGQAAAAGQHRSTAALVLIAPLSNETAHQGYAPVAIDPVLTPANKQLVAEMQAFMTSFVVDSPDIQDLAPDNSNDGEQTKIDEARWKGIYVGQMKARIERIWQRPRTPIDGRADSTLSTANYFSCQVQVIQDDHGNVQEILLPSCNGSADWQRSLVLAIQHSSPLPAPPDQSVFNRAVTLEFIAYPYRPGDSEEGYQ